MSLETSPTDLTAASASLSARGNSGIVGHMSDVTRLLEAAGRGDGQAATDLLPLVYEELRKLAAVRMAQERADHTLDATALVHETSSSNTGATSLRRPPRRCAASWSTGPATGNA